MTIAAAKVLILIQGWVPFATLPTQVPNAWLMMGAIQWLPLGIGPASSDYNLTGYIEPTLAGTIGGVTFSLILTLTSSDTAALSVNPPPLYTGYGDCYGKDYKEKYLFSATGTTLISYPFGAYTVNSPIRPICLTLDIPENLFTAFGDWYISSKGSASTVKVSGWHDLDPSFVLPTGFTPITFTGQSSTIGTVWRLIQITSSAGGFIYVVTPQTQLNSTAKVVTRADLAILKLDHVSGNATFYAVDKWFADSAMIRAILPITSKGGVFVFGYLDNSINTALPAGLEVTTSFMGAWGKKIFNFAGCYVTITGTSDLDFFVSETTGRHI
jgi:hypothetical protein